MAQVAPRSRLSPQEYLAFERDAETKHEYADGEIFDRSVCNWEHCRITSNILGALDLARRERRCEVHTSDLRIKITATGRYVYPDLSVVCERPALEDECRDSLLNPTAVFEVFSDATERYDRGDKFAQYRSIASLQDYILVSQKAALIEHYSRQANGIWFYRALGPGEQLILEKAGCEIPVDQVYLQVFDAPRGD